MFKFIGIFVLAAVLQANILMAQESLKVFDAQSGKYVQTQKVVKTPQEWKRQLNPISYNVTREHGTETPFTGRYHDHHRKGIYKCIGCGLDLYRSDDKFESGTGWPSFTKPIDPANNAYSTDKTLFMERTEVHCPRCSAHLGHVFDDGPAPTGKRYCINSASLNFVETK